MITRFPSRYLGRYRFYGIVLFFGGGSAALGFRAYEWLRADPSLQHSWHVWTGNIVLAMFLVAYAFSLRKWAFKLKFFQNIGVRQRTNLDSLWTGLQELNRQIVRGLLKDHKEIMQRANEVLKKSRTAGIRTPHIEETDLGQGRKVPLVRVRRKELFGRLESWMEFHVALGLVGCVGVYFHADMAVRSLQGWLLFGLSAIVLGTGLIEAVVYRLAPPLLARLHFGFPYEECSVRSMTYSRCTKGVLERQDDSSGCSQEPDTDLHLVSRPQSHSA